MGGDPKLTRAVLVKIMVSEGYMVFRVSTMPGESVTVSRKDWADSEPPLPGTDVILEGSLIHHRGGWRAKKARYLKPDDAI